MNARLVFGSPIDGLLDRLYARSAAQTEALTTYFTARAAEGSLDWNQFDERTNEFLRDKLIALDRAKAEFCYHLCRALSARRVVEAGTSFGVSTLFLAAGVRDNRRQELQGVNLVDTEGPVDFMLIDIWTPMARPALSLIAPHLREGAVVICDNTLQFREAYREYFDFVQDPHDGIRTMTLPFEGGLEFTVRAH